MAQPGTLTSLEWWLNQRVLRSGDAGVRFEFAHALQPWEWAMLLACAGVIAWWGYRRLEGPAWARLALGAVRGALLALLIALACGPRLVRPNETSEKDWVLALVDRSSSMLLVDAPGPGGGRVSRDEQLRAALGHGAEVFARLGREKRVLWMGFDAGAYELKGAGPGAVELGTATGRRSDLGGAIEAALGKAAARPISGIVIFSDGRSSDSLTRATVRRLAAERVPVFSVALGSPEALSDQSVRSAAGPGVAFVNDPVPVEVELQRTGSVAREGSGNVQLIDALTGAVLSERRVNWAGDASGAGPQTQRLTLTSTPASPGNTRWTVRIVPDGTDLVAGNNTQSVGVELIDRPLTVLQLDGYPRWEYRFMKNLLSREKSMRFASMLLSQGRRYLQEGSLELPAVPASAAEWHPIDVIVMGDVRPEVFTPEQMAQIRQRVALGGAGLVWIAGESAVPSSWRATPLDDLLPFAPRDGGSAGQRLWDRDVTISPTPAADRLGVLRLAPEPGPEGTYTPAGLSDPASGWSRLRWAQRIDPGSLKPAAEVLALATPVSETGSSDPALSTPAVVTMRFGAGRVLYVATDEIWRWRFGKGEDLPEKFWLQLIRLLGRESLARAGRAAILDLSPARAEVGQVVRVALSLQDQALIDQAPASVSVRVTRLGDTGDEPASDPGRVSEGTSELVLRAGQGDASSRRTFSAAWVPRQTGRYRVSVTDPLLSEQNIWSEAEVWLSDDELRQPETDHPLLAKLSKETGGAVLTGEELPRLEKLLPRREQRITLTPDEQTLWDSPLALASVLGLLLAEWIGRRLIRLA